MPRSVTVVGGGIGGLTAALAFARQGAVVTVLEQASALTAVGAGIQITPNGARVLDALGLGPALANRGLRAEALEPHDGLTGRRLARFDFGRLSGPPYRFFHRADLIDLLAEAARAAGVTLRAGVKVMAMSPEGQVTLVSGAAPEADLVVGADGLHSVLRANLNGPDAPFFTGQVAWRAVVPVVSPPIARIWMFPHRHVVTYPLPGGRTNLVAVREQSDWVPEGWHHPDRPEALRAAFPDACTALGGLLDAVTETGLWGLFRHPVAGRWHGPATALLGDAAHPTLPFLAQGANLAIEDAWVLAAQTMSAAPLARGLAAYQTDREARVRRAIAAAEANAGAYHLSGLRRRGAHAGLRILGHVAPQLFLRRFDWLYGRDVTA